MNISKYFWDLNEMALKETKKIILDPTHRKFPARMVTLLSRCDDPKVLFSIIPGKEFIAVWPKLRSYWVKVAGETEFRDWWETIYEEMLYKYQSKQKKPSGRAPALFSKIGSIIKEARVQKGLNQKELAFMVGMKQPDISTIEEGRKNATLHTLSRLCKVLDIKKIDI
jgi:DNA-binding Xre family transcriptional regulator